MAKIDNDAQSHFHSMIDGGDKRDDKEIEMDASWRALHDQTPKRSRKDFQKERNRLTDKRVSAKAYVNGHNFKNESKKMNNRMISLTESALHRIVRESVYRVLKEDIPSMGIGEPSFNPEYINVIKAVRHLVDELEKVGADENIIDQAWQIEHQFVDSYGDNGITDEMLNQ